jgi:transposase
VRYELSDSEWAAIKPLLPNKSRGVRRVNDRRVLNGIFWVLRSGAPWRPSPPDETVVAGGAEYGAGSWTLLPPLMMRPSK